MSSGRRSPRKRKSRWPHTDTFVRLMRSEIHGIGIVAIRPIPKGASVFGAHYDEEIVEVPARVVARTRGAQRAFYDDFAVLDVSVYRCPKSFNLLTPSWYLNHSDTPNVKLDCRQRFVAARRIRAGEELVVDYRTFSNDPMPWRKPGASHTVVSPRSGVRTTRRLASRRRKLPAAHRRASR